MWIVSNRIWLTLTVKFALDHVVCQSCARNILTIRRVMSSCISAKSLHLAGQELHHFGRFPCIQRDRAWPGSVKKSTCCKPLHDAVPHLARRSAPTALQEPYDRARQLRSTFWICRNAADSTKPGLFRYSHRGNTTRCLLDAAETILLQTPTQTWWTHHNPYSCCHVRRTSQNVRSGTPGH